MKKHLLLGMLLAFCIHTYADIWELPTEQVYYSENKEFMLKIFPTTTPEKYSKWKAAKPNKKKKYSASDTTVNHCYAVLYHIGNSDTTEVWNKKLTNEIIPVHAIVANDGKSIATFDDWSRAGYGNNVMVIYNENGDLTERYKLEELSTFPINEYKLSKTSIWWRCGVKYLDNSTLEICFQDSKENKETRQYSLKNQEFKK